MAVAPEEIINLDKGVEIADVLKAVYCFAQQNPSKKFQVSDLSPLIFPYQLAEKSRQNQISTRLTSLIQQGFITSDNTKKIINRKYSINFGEKLIQGAYDHLDPEIYPYFLKIKSGKIAEIKTDFAAIKINTLKEITDKVVFMAMSSIRGPNGYSPRLQTRELIKKQSTAELKNVSGKVDGVLKKESGLIGTGLCQSFEGIKPIYRDDLILTDEKIIIESMLKKIQPDLPTYYSQALAAQNQLEKDTAPTVPIENNKGTSLEKMKISSLIGSSIYGDPEKQSKKRKREDEDSSASKKEVTVISDSDSETASESETIDLT